MCPSLSPCLSLSELFLVPQHHSYIMMARTGHIMIISCDLITIFLFIARLHSHLVTATHLIYDLPQSLQPYCKNMFPYHAFVHLFFFPNEYRTVLFFAIGLHFIGYSSVFMSINILFHLKLAMPLTLGSVCK